MTDENVQNEQSQEGAAPNIIDELEKKIVAAQNGEEAVQPETSSADDGEDLLSTKPDEWFLIENMKGDGERPAWLKSKYKSVEAQAKAYDELEKRFGGLSGAPEAYNYEGTDIESIGLEPTSDVTKNFESIAKQLNLNQESFTKIFNYFANEVAPAISEGENISAVNVEKERAKLGSEGMKRAQQVRGWLENKLSESDFKAIKGTIVTADAVNAYYNLINKVTAGILPTLPNMDGPKNVSPAELKTQFQKDIAAAGRDHAQLQAIMNKYAATELNKPRGKR